MMRTYSHPRGLKPALYVDIGRTHAARNMRRLRSGFTPQWEDLKKEIREELFTDCSLNSHVRIIRAQAGDLGR